MSKWHRVYVNAGGLETVHSDSSGNIVNRSTASRLCRDDLNDIVSNVKYRAKWRKLRHTEGHWGFTAVIKFKDEQDLFWFQMAHADRILPPETVKNSAMVNVLRRTMPSVMAQSIIGVQPMTAPTSQTYALKTRYANSKK